MAETDDITDNNTSNMTDAQKRLFALRMKINKSRKENKDEVEKEYKRMTDPNYESKQRLAESYEQKIKEGKVKKYSKEDSILHETAENAEKIAEKKHQKEKHMATFGWHSFTQDASFRAYEKRLAKIPKKDFSGEEEDVQQHGTLAVAGGPTSSSAVSTSTMNPLDYGRVGATVSKAGIERLTRDIDEHKATREQFSRRRKTYDSSTVDAINEDNAEFNKKIKRAYDKYTVETRQNLERGTAI